MGANDNTAKVKVLAKPPGEAGNRKKGYKLRYAMELRGRAGKKLYSQILVRRVTVSEAFNFPGR